MRWESRFKISADADATRTDGGICSSLKYSGQFGHTSLEFLGHDLECGLLCNLFKK